MNEKLYIDEVSFKTLSFLYKILVQNARRAMLVGNR